MSAAFGKEIVKGAATLATTMVPSDTGKRAIPSFVGKIRDTLNILNLDLDNYLFAVANKLIQLKLSSSRLVSR